MGSYEQQTLLEENQFLRGEIERLRQRRQEERPADPRAPALAAVGAALAPIPQPRAPDPEQQTLDRLKDEFEMLQDVLRLQQKIKTLTNSKANY
jgi:hypothetical protein